jgi:hypothetical protein
VKLVAADSSIRALNSAAVKGRCPGGSWRHCSGQRPYNANTVFRYDFTSSSSQAFGNNMILNGTRWCIYSGDVDQDGVIDASDISKVDNDASASVSGYNSTDLDGDYLTDSNDLSILDNNLQFSKIVVKP